MISTSATMYALLNEDSVVMQLVIFTDYGVFRRDDSEWVPVEQDDEEDPLSGLQAVDATDSFTALFDMSEQTGGTLTQTDVS